MWRDFLAFYRTRVRPPFFDFEQEAAQRGIGRNREPLGDPALLLPRSRSNVWPRSWKRFMIDFMFGRVRARVHADAVCAQLTCASRPAHAARCEGGVEMEEEGVTEGCGSVER